MAQNEPPEIGTLTIAALLLLTLAFAGYWIMTYADTGRPGRPWVLFEWFGAAAVVIILIGLLAGLRGGRPRGPQ